MLLCRKRMLVLMKKRNMRSLDIAREIGIDPTNFSHMLAGRRRLDLRQSKLLIEMFGAELMSMVIDWDGMGIKNPLEGRDESY